MWILSRTGPFLPLWGSSTQDKLDRDTNFWGPAVPCNPCNARQKPIVFFCGSTVHIDKRLVTCEGTCPAALTQLHLRLTDCIQHEYVWGGVCLYKMIYTVGKHNVRKLPHAPSTCRLCGGCQAQDKPAAGTLSGHKRSDQRGAAVAEAPGLRLHKDHVQAAALFKLQQLWEMLCEHVFLKHLLAGHMHYVAGWSMASKWTMVAEVTIFARLEADDAKLLGIPCVHSRQMLASGSGMG